MTVFPLTLILQQGNTTKHIVDNNTLYSVKKFNLGKNSPAALKIWVNSTWLSCVTKPLIMTIILKVYIQYYSTLLFKFCYILGCRILTKSPNFIPFNMTKK